MEVGHAFGQKSTKQELCAGFQWLHWTFFILWSRATPKVKSMNCMLLSYDVVSGKSRVSI